MQEEADAIVNYVKKHDMSSVIRQFELQKLNEQLVQNAKYNSELLA